LQYSTLLYSSNPTPIIYSLLSPFNGKLGFVLSLLLCHLHYLSLFLCFTYVCGCYMLPLFTQHHYSQTCLFLQTILCLRFNPYPVFLFLIYILLVMLYPTSLSHHILTTLCPFTSSQPLSKDLSSLRCINRLLSRAPYKVL